MGRSAAIKAGARDLGDGCGSHMPFRARAEPAVKSAVNVNAKGPVQNTGPFVFYLSHFLFCHFGAKRENDKK